MAEYVVQPGDNLSTIAKKYNVPVNSITGYKSGNPNLIYSGEKLNIGSGTTSPATKPAPQATAPVSQPASSSSVDVSGATQQAQSMVAPLDTSGMESTAANIQKYAQSLSESKKAQVPLIQNIYTNLAQKLQQSFEADKKTKEQEKTSTIGQNKAAAAAGGFETTSGFEAAQNRVLTSQYDKQIQDIATKFNTDSATLGSQQEKDINTIMTEAQQALLDGETQVADIGFKIAGLKQQQSSLLSSAVNAIMNAQSDAEKNKIAKDYNDSQIALKKNELGLTAMQIKRDQYSPIATYDPATGSTVYAAFDKVSGKIIDPKTGEAIDATKPGAFTESQKADFANQYAQGTITAAQIPQAIRGEVVAAGEEAKKASMGPIGKLKDWFSNLGK